MSAPDPGPAPSSSDGVPEQLPGVAGGRTSRRPGPPPRAPHRGDPSVWAPPGPPTAPPPPSRGRRALVATVVTVVVVTLAGLGALGWWATSTARDAATSVPPVGTGWSAPPAGRLLTALDAAALECVVEVADPEQHVCFALAPEDWAEVHWQVGDGRVAGLTATVDHSAGPGSVAARVVAATAVGLDLPDADLSALVRALEQVAAGAEGGEPVLVDTVWGALQLRPAGGGWVDLAGQSHDTPTRPHAGKDLGLGLDAATGLVQQHGYRCGEPEEDAGGGYSYLTCESGPRQVRLTTAEDRLVAVQVSDPPAQREVVSALLAVTAPADRAVLEQLHRSTGEQPSVRAGAGWVALHDGGWLWLGAGRW